MLHQQSYFWKHNKLRMIDDGEGITIIDITYPILCACRQVSFWWKGYPQNMQPKPCVKIWLVFQTTPVIRLWVIRNETPGPKHSSVWHNLNKRVAIKRYILRHRNFCIDLFYITRILRHLYCLQTGQQYRSRHILLTDIADV